MDIKALKQFIANKSTKRPLNESVPPAIQKYKTQKETYGLAYDAGEAVSRHPAVQQYFDHVHKTMPTGDRESNAAYVAARRRLPKDVVDKVAKDYDIDANTVRSVYGTFTQD